MCAIYCRTATFFAVFIVIIANAPVIFLAPSFHVIIPVFIRRHHHHFYVPCHRRRGVHTHRTHASIKRM